MIEWFIDTFSALQTLLFESVVQPIAFAGGAGNLLDVAYEGTGWFLIGLLQILILLVFVAPLEKWRPSEPVTDSQGVKVDVIYTLIHRLGLFKLVSFSLLKMLLIQCLACCACMGFQPSTLTHSGQASPTLLGSVSFSTLSSSILLTI